MTGNLDLFFGRQFPFYFREGFSYQKYLEEKSHFDRVEFAIDRNMAAQIASNERIAALAYSQSESNNSSILSQLETISEKLGMGFSTISASLDEVNNNLKVISFILDRGFSKLAASLAEIDETLNELVKIAKTPDQTWAFEQYEIALDCFKKNLFEESFDYVNRAIEGHKERPGFRLEHRFYMLRGLLKMGGYKNYEADFVNLEGARSDFLTAVRYSENDQPFRCARAYGMAGYASYCMGKMDEALSYYEKSLEKNEGDKSSLFEIAKTLFNIEKFDVGKEYLARLLRLDHMYCLRAASEPEFILNSNQFDAVISDYWNELSEEIRTLLQPYTNNKLVRVIEISKSHGFSSEILIFERINAIEVIDKMSISEVCDLKKNCENFRWFDEKMFE